MCLTHNLHFHAKSIYCLFYHSVQCDQMINDGINQSFWKPSKTKHAIICSFIIDRNNVNMIQFKCLGRHPRGSEKLYVSNDMTLHCFVYFSFATTLLYFYFIIQQVSAVGKAILITGCESPLAWCLARKLDDLGFTVFAGFTKRTGCTDADSLKEESSGRTKILQLDVTSETQVCQHICAILACLPSMLPFECTVQLKQRLQSVYFRRRMLGW